MTYDDKVVCAMTSETRWINGCGWRIPEQQPLRGIRMEGDSATGRPTDGEWRSTWNMESGVPGTRRSEEPNPGS